MKDKIIFNFQKLAEKQGFYGATVDELAKSSSMSKRTIYRYFNTKEEIILAVLQQTMTDVEEKIDQVLSEAADPIEKITNFMRVIAEKLRGFDSKMLSDLQRHYPHIWEKLEQFRAEKVKRIINILIDGSKEGYFREINPVIVTSSLLTTIRAVVNPTFVVENNLTLEQAFKAVFDTFLYGIVVER